MDNSQVEQIQIEQISNGHRVPVKDMVTVEEPLEIQLAYSSTTGRMQRNIAVTMRTPGHDKELAVGFLFTEGIIADTISIAEIAQPASDENSILITLHENAQPKLTNSARNFYTTSSCGICGKASIESIRTCMQSATHHDQITVSASIFYQLQNKLRDQQHVFDETGGIHAAALFDIEGNFITLREDVGRHNALDKLIGYALLNNLTPIKNNILLLSGRASFELIQKAAMAGITIVAAVGAPSSLAVDTAKEFNITLIGFLKNSRFNIYSGNQRIIMS